ncbi:sulfotransferase domain-containing protein [Novosphingobium beihaiensis]|uniref:Sulfotransferase domain-containing protein n=1 Tax=Novosphingobium beihaiensis TaxID=2930389 RepID=A0ABT0BKX8_9SPHN|nr:sulfotransferase domain-containing protein [Novosphingobium beihaiensis]MCJ2185384.1 sulfotransferase domain-containing protein [Novosphingobium beihaiensis]
MILQAFSAALKMIKRAYWIASYPKSGNTWIRLILRHISSGGNFSLNHGDESALASSRKIIDPAVGLPTVHLSPDDQENLRPKAYRFIARERIGKTILKAHDAYDRTAGGEWLFPPDITAGAVYLVRNPLDIAVSWAFHADISIDEAVDFLCDDRSMIADPHKRATPIMRQILRSWSTHVTSWQAAPIPKLCLRYEDIVSDPITHFARIAHFLQFTASPDALRNAVAACRFDRLQELESDSGFGERVSARTPFFRNGRPGDWHNHLKSRHINKIISCHGDIMKKLDYKLPAGY